MDALNILAHQTGKFGIVTVIDATIYDMDGQAILELDTLKVANFATEAQEKVITGGKANDQLIIYNHSRTATLDLQDAVASMSSLGFLWGTDLIPAGAVTEHVKDTASMTSGIITMPTDTAVAATKVTVTDGTLNGTFIASGSATEDLTSIEVLDTEGDAVVFDAVTATVTIWYEKLNANATALTLSSSGFAPNVKIVGKTFLIDQATGAQKFAELVIHNYKLNPSFALAFDAAGDASVFDFSGTALVDSNGDIVTIKYLGLE